MIVCCANIFTVKLWDGFTGAFINTFRGHVGPVYQATAMHLECAGVCTRFTVKTLSLQIAWAPDSRLLVSGSKDSTLKIWDASSRKLLMDLPGHADEVFR